MAKLPFDLKGKTVFVAGHRGMVGSALVRRLASEDVELLTIGRGEVDLRDQAAVFDWFAGKKPQAVFLAAAKVGGIVANNTLRAEFLLRDKKTQEGEALLQDVVKMILARPGPDAWSAARFELEALAKTARQYGDWNLSESIARAMIQHDGTYAGGYFALGLAAEHAGHAAQAREQFAAAEKFWSKADKDLPELRRIQEAVSARR